MADQIQKFLAKLSRREHDLVQAALLDIFNGELDHLDIKPLKGQKNIFRVRKGDVRIVFYRDKDSTRLLQVGRRDTQTYRMF